MRKCSIFRLRCSGQKFLIRLWILRIPRAIFAHGCAEGICTVKARELGCNKIALGHHFDDVIETIVMGMLYGAQIQTMMPKLHSTNFEGMELIRPLYLVREADIIHWAQYNDLHFIQCACRFTEGCASCGGTEKGSKRADVKRLIHSLEQENPYVAKKIFSAVWRM